MNEQPSSKKKVDDSIPAVLRRRLKELRGDGYNFEFCRVLERAADHIERLENICGAAYQLAGLVGAPVRFLDALSRYEGDIDHLCPVSLDECEPEWVASMHARYGAADEPRAEQEARGRGLSISGSPNPEAGADLANMPVIDNEVHEQISPAAPYYLDGLTIEQWREHAKAGWKMYAERAAEPPKACHLHPDAEYGCRKCIELDVAGWQSNQCDTPQACAAMGCAVQMRAETKPACICRTTMRVDCPVHGPRGTAPVETEAPPDDTAHELLNGDD